MILSNVFVFVLNVINFLLTVAASLVAERQLLEWQTLLYASHLCVVSGVMELQPPFCVLVCPLLQSSV